MVGDDERDTAYRKEVLKAIHDRELDTIVRLLPQTDDIAAAYSLAAVVVAPSVKPEGFGRIPVEAQAMGRPVVASDIGGFRETIVNGVTGLLVPAGDAQSLAAAIGSALELTADHRESLAADASAHIEARFTRAHMCAATLDVYRELAGGAWTSGMQRP
jgi:glycosyltransferase involved in cell wall biosynthesis